MEEIQTIERKLRKGEYISKVKQHEKRHLRKNATGIVLYSVWFEVWFIFCMNSLLYTVQTVMHSFFPDIWKSFNEIFCAATDRKIDGFITCTTCKKVLAFSPKSGTGNAISHLKKHSSVPAAVPIDNFVIKRRIIISPADKSDVIESCVNFVAMDMRPFATLNGEGILDYTNTIWNLGAKYGSVSCFCYQK